MKESVSADLFGAIEMMVLERRADLIFSRIS